MTTVQTVTGPVAVNELGMVVAAMLAERGTHPTLIGTLLRDTPARMLAGDSGLAPD